MDFYITSLCSCLKLEDKNVAKQSKWKTLAWFNCQTHSSLNQNKVPFVKKSVYKGMAAYHITQRLLHFNLKQALKFPKTTTKDFWHFLNFQI